MNPHSQRSTCFAGRWETVTRFREASGPAPLRGLHPGRNDHLRASHPGAGRREGVDHERRGICHREGQGAWPKVSSSGGQKVTAAALPFNNLSADLTEAERLTN